MKIYAIPADSEEQLAVITARTSRSPDTFDVIGKEIKEKGHKEFIKTNVLGYGHDSVAEMAMCPAIAIEGASDLAMNIVATSDPQLRVQITSTRYQDMAQRPALDQNGFRSLIGEDMKLHYQQAMDIIGILLERHDLPRKRTLQCDIARALLPAGMSTQGAIRGDARTMRDAVCYMLGHSNEEVQKIGKGIIEATKGSIEVLFDRHINPAEINKQVTCGRYPEDQFTILSMNSQLHEDFYMELIRWRDSGWRRRMRLAAAPGAFGAYHFQADYGAYRDLRRNRTIHQSDLNIEGKTLPNDWLWAFREFYPVLCDEIDMACGDLVSSFNKLDTRHSAYTTPMGAEVDWDSAGHLFNWAYFMRLRSGAVCHPGYAIPVKKAMASLFLQNPYIAECMGLVMKPFVCDFSDRV